MVGRRSEMPRSTGCHRWAGSRGRSGRRLLGGRDQWALDGELELAPGDVVGGDEHAASARPADSAATSKRR